MKICKSGKSPYNLKDSEKQTEELIIFNCGAKKTPTEKRQKLLELVKIMFEEDFDE